MSLQFAFVFLVMINLVRRSDFLVLSKILFLLLFQHIVHSMKDPSIAAFWLFTLPEVAGGFEYDDDVKKKVWWQYKVYLFIFGTCPSLLFLLFLWVLLHANASETLSKHLKLQIIPSTEVLSKRIHEHMVSFINSFKVDENCASGTYSDTKPYLESKLNQLKR